MNVGICRQPQGAPRASPKILLCSTAGKLPSKLQKRKRRLQLQRLCQILVISFSSATGSQQRVLSRQKRGKLGGTTGRLCNCCQEGSNALTDELSLPAQGCDKFRIISNLAVHLLRDDKSADCRRSFGLNLPSVEDQRAHTRSNSRQDEARSIEARCLQFEPAILLELPDTDDR